MGQFGKAAIRAVTLFTDGEAESPKEAWETATAEIGYDKGCPKDAFLGLCEAGLVKGVPSGNYTRSRKNKGYAIRALQILEANPALADYPERLWDEVMQDEQKEHNKQMDVVAALWREGMLRT